MDYFERFFEVKRTGQTKELLNANLDNEFSEMKNSQWFKDLNLGIQCFQLEDYSPALEFLNNALILKPDNSYISEVIANTYENMNNFHKAIEYYKTSLNYCNDNYQLYYKIGVCYFLLKDFQKSLLAFDFAIEIKQYNEKNYLNDDVLPEIFDGIRRKTPTEVMFTNRANLKLSIEDYDGCFDDCKIAIEINPTYSISFLTLGKLYIQIGQKDEAYSIFKHSEFLGNTTATEIIRQFFTQ